MKSVALVLCISFILFYNYYYDGTDFFQSKINGQYYKVQTGYNEERKADLLANLNNKLDVLVKTVKEIYPDNEDVQRLIKNWEKGISIKEVGKMESDAAYVINKQNISFCLQESSEINHSNINLITYVGIHELAHIMSIEIGHGSEFIKNFEFLLNAAKTIDYYDPLLNKNIKLYTQLNQLATADNYCGVKLTNSMN